MPSDAQFCCIRSGTANSRLGLARNVVKFP